MRACNCARASPFQSTHPRGVRPAALARAYRAYPRFNPRTRVGCDLTSITCGCLRDGGFNPRTRVGCDSAYPDSTATALGFNPRTRVGCDVLLVFSRLVFVGFNPRTRVGCDQCPHTGLAFVWHVSIHAPAWGATISRFRVSAFAGCFNPRTRVGCDGPRVRPAAEQAGFNPRTRVGCD